MRFFSFRRPSVAGLPRVVEWLTIAPALLIPLFFLTLTPDSMEFNKATLLVFLTVTAAVLWWVGAVRRRRLTVAEGPFLRLSVIFLAVATLAWLFSRYQYVGFFGVPGFYNHPLLHLAVLSLFLFLLSRLERLSAVGWVLRLFGLAGGVVALYNLMKYFGLEVFPFAQTGTATFNLLTNSTGLLAVFTVTVFLLALGSAIDEAQSGWRIVQVVVAVLSFALTVVLDHQIGWLTLIIGLLVLLVVRLASARSSPRVVIGLSLLLAAAIVLFLVPVQRFSPVSPPADILLDNRTSTAITGQALRQSTVFGAGPDSFPYVFVSSRPQAYNDTPFWNLRFLKARNEFHQLLASLGIVGTVTFFAFVIVLGLSLIQRLRRDGEAGWLPVVGATWLTNAVALFFYPMSFITAFSFFLLSGLAVRLLAPADLKTVELTGRQPTGALLGLSLSIVVGAVVVFLVGRVWLGEVAYAQAARAINQTEDLANVRQRLLRAIALNPLESKYFFTLAQAELVRVQLEVTKDQPDRQLVEESSRLALEALRNAVITNPRYPETYEHVADTYTFAQQVLQMDFSQAIIEAYQQAAGIEPTNPLHYLRAGQVVLARTDAIIASLDQLKDDQRKQAEEQREQELTQAEGLFREAQRLKRDFPAADLGLALLVERRGKPAEALQAMEAILARAPGDLDTLFAYGRLLRDQGRKDDAIAAFQVLTTLNPQHVEAFLHLAQLYEEQGKKAEARAAYEKVNELAPGSPGIQKKLEELK